MNGGAKRAAGGPSHSKGLTFFMLFSGMAVFGSATPISKIVTEALPELVGAGLRVAIGASVLLPFAFSRLGQVRAIGRRDWFLTGVIALFGMFGFSALMLFGMKMVSGVVGSVVMSATPAVTAAAAMVLLGESATWRKFTAIGLAVVGVLILQLGQSRGSGGNDVLLGAALVFAAVCCEAVYTLVGRTLSQDIDPILVAFLACILSLPLFVVFSAWQWSAVDFASVDVAAWSALVWYGAGTLALGTWLWYSGIAKAEGSTAAGFMGVMPASALILSYVLLGEDFKAVHLLGFGTVFVGVLLISWEHARMSDA